MPFSPEYTPLQYRMHSVGAGPHRRVPLTGLDSRARRELQIASGSPNRGPTPRVLAIAIMTDSSIYIAGAMD